ncbi:MAG: 50S ribosomal protein L6 [Candidatus Pacebacteria bacterium]|nr:50S ribosomal protein L6 [Candidatus Paceibacterota bacterium]
MSKIGKKPVDIVSGVTVQVEADQVVVKGPKGELTAPILPGIKVETKDNQVQVSPLNNQRQTRAYHGLVRSLIENHVIGVTKGYQKTLKLVGTGYRAKAAGQNVSVTVGFSHPVEIKPLTGVTLKVEGNDTIHVSGADKQAVGQMAAQIRAIRPPEPYKGKGIRYEDEVVSRKPGKTAVG